MSLQANAGRTPRAAWSDAFRGFVVFFIAVFHTANFFVIFGVDAMSASHFVDDLQSLGMGLFFYISGSNSRKYVDAPREYFINRRVWAMVYLFIVWTLITSLVDYLVINGAGSWRGLGGTLLWSLIFPTSNMWFLWSLIVYHVACRLLMRPYPTATLVVSFALSVVCITLDSSFFHRHHLYLIEWAWSWRRVFSYPFFFFLGYRYPGIAATIAKWPLLVTLVVAFATAWELPRLAFAINKTAAIVPLLYLSLLFGQVSGISIGRVLAALPVIGRFLRWVGQLTLPIYVMHGIIALLLVELALRVDRSGIQAHLLPVVLVIAFLSVAGSLAFAFALPSMRLVWLLRPPATPGWRRPAEVQPS